MKPTTLALSSAALLAMPFASATSFYWDANGGAAGSGGTGVWDTASSLWASGSAGGTLATWTNTVANTDSAQLAGSAGTLTLNTSSTNINVNNLTFGTTGYIIAGPASGTAKLNLAGTTPTIDTGTLSATISAGLIGSAGLTKNGSGTLTLSGANTYTGKTIISAGTVSINNIGSVGAASSALGAPADAASGTIDLGGTLIYTGGTKTSDRVFNLTATATIRNDSASALTLTGGITGVDRKINFRGTGSITETGLIAIGSGQLYRTEYGTLTLTNAANSFSGSVTVAQGTVSVNSISNGGTPSALGQGSSIILGQTSSGGFGTLRFTGANGGASDRAITINTTSGTTGHGGLIENTVVGQTLTLTGNVGIGGAGTSPRLELLGAGNGELAGEIGGTGLGVTKSGSGTWTLSNANTYSGGTVVKNSGTLRVTNGSGSATGSGFVSIETGATLAGPGIIAGAVNVSTGAFLKPGTSAGNLTLNSGLTLAGTYQWDLGALSTTSPGSNFDTLTITAGNVNIVGAALGLNLGAFAPGDTPFWSVDQTWTGILNNTGLGTLTGSFTAIDNSAWSEFGSFSTIITSNDVNLVWTAVPELDSATLVGGLGMLALLRRRQS
jgi:fibronectin-binding autotransporter adhesin